MALEKIAQMRYLGYFCRYEKVSFINSIMSRITNLIYTGFAMAGVVAAACSRTDGHSVVLGIDLRENRQTGVADSIFEVVGVLHPALTDSTMLEWGEVVGVDGDRLYINDRNMMLFDMTDNSSIASFSHKGEGPEEYLAAWYVWKTVGGDGWTVTDLRRDRILGYDDKGDFLSATDNDSIGFIAPLGDGWIAECDFAEGMPKRYFLYSADWQPRGTIVSPLIFKSADNGNLIQETDYNVCGNEFMVAENDTLYNVDAGKGFVPIAAFDCGNLSMPMFQSFEEMIARRDDYIRYNVSATAAHLLVISYHNKVVTVRLYRRRDGELLFCESHPHTPDYTFTITHRGQEMGVVPQFHTDGRYFYFTVSSPVMAGLMGDEESNPAILRVRIRD